VSIRALLLDLDDTLLVNDMQDFASGYYRALLGRLGTVCPPVRLMEAFQAGTSAMLRNDGRGLTNEEVFYREFLPRTGCSREEIVPLLEAFYQRDFDALEVYTASDPDARRLVKTARARGLQLAIATQPLFPRTAILARLRWADVPHEEFGYEYVSSAEVMTACKPHPVFFRTILEALERGPDECLMVGDSVESDLPAARLGIKTFWIDRDRGVAPEAVAADAKGTLADLISLIETGAIHEL